MANETNRIGGNFNFKPLNVNEKKPEVFRLRENNENPFAESNRDKFLGGNILQFRLNQNFSGEPINPPAADPQKVADAVKQIKDSLNQSWTDWDVTHGDLETIQNTFRDLNSAEANEAFRGLSDDDLKRWTSELSGTIGGYSSEEKQQLFNDLAGKLDGKNLAKFAEILGTKDNPADGSEENVEALSRAIAGNASPEAKVEFVKTLAASASDNEQNALAIAEVIGGLKDNPAALKEALGALDDKQLKAVVNAATKEEYNASLMGGTGTMSFDAAPLRRMLDAAATSDDPRLKARVFDVAGQRLKEIEEPGLLTNITAPSIDRSSAAREIREGLTNILNSDTIGVTTALENDNKGQGLKAYVKSMLNTGNEADQKIIGTMISRLLTGNDNKENQIARFERQVPGTTGLLYNQNARTLGFFAGAIHSATASMAGDRAKQANVIKNVFGAAAGIIGGVFPAAAAPAAGVTGLTNQAVDEVVSSMDDEGYDLRDGLLKLTMPRDANGHLYTGPARDSYDAAFAATAARNNR